MTYAGLTVDNNLSDIGSTHEAWDNLGNGVDYSYSTVRANYINNSSAPFNGDRSQVVVSQASGVPLSYGNYAYKITEQAGTATQFNFGFIRYGSTSVSYTNPERRLAVSNGPIVGSILLKAGSHYSVGMALRPGNGGAFFKATNYPIVSIDLKTGEYRDAFSSKKPYEIIGAAEEEEGWWRVAMSSICQQAYAVAAIDLFFFRADSFNVIDPATSTDGSKFFYAALPQIEAGHEPSPIIITFNDEPVLRSTTAQSLGGIVFNGDDIEAIDGLASVGSDNLGKLGQTKSLVQPRLSSLATSGNALAASGTSRLASANAVSSGNYALSGLVASGYYVGPNAIGSVSGSPFSGNTSTVPLFFDALTIQSWKTRTTFASGTLANKTIAIPIEYNDFYVAVVAGQS